MSGLKKYLKTKGPTDRHTTDKGDYRGTRRVNPDSTTTLESRQDYSTLNCNMPVYNFKLFPKFFGTISLCAWIPNFLSLQQIICFYKRTWKNLKKCRVYSNTQNLLKSQYSKSKTILQHNFNSKSFLIRL